MKLSNSVHNNTGGVDVRMGEQLKENRKQRNEAFVEGLIAGFVVIGTIAVVLLLIFWL